MEAILTEAMRYGDPRSGEYKLGALDLLCRRAFGIEFPKRFKMGSVQADAYWSGVERGWMVWHKLERVRVEEEI